MSTRCIHGGTHQTKHKQQWIRNNKFMLCNEIWKTMDACIAVWRFRRNCVEWACSCWLRWLGSSSTEILKFWTFFSFSSLCSHWILYFHGFYSTSFVCVCAESWVFSFSQRRYLMTVSSIVIFFRRTYISHKHHRRSSSLSPFHTPRFFFCQAFFVRKVSLKQHGRRILLSVDANKRM